MVNSQWDIETNYLEAAIVIQFAAIVKRRRFEAGYVGKFKRNATENGGTAAIPDTL